MFSIKNYLFENFDILEIEGYISPKYKLTKKFYFEIFILIRLFEKLRSVNEIRGISEINPRKIGLVDGTSETFFPTSKLGEKANYFSKIVDRNLEVKNIKNGLFIEDTEVNIENITFTSMDEHIKKFKVDLNDSLEEAVLEMSRKVNEEYIKKERILKQNLTDDLMAKVAKFLSSSKLLIDIEKLLIKTITDYETPIKDLQSILKVLETSNIHDKLAFDEAAFRFILE